MSRRRCPSCNKRITTLAVGDVMPAHSPTSRSYRNGERWCGGAGLKLVAERPLRWERVMDSEPLRREDGIRVQPFQLAPLAGAASGHTLVCPAGCVAGLKGKGHCQRCGGMGRVAAYLAGEKRPERRL